MICILLGVQPPKEEIGCSIVEVVTRGLFNNNNFVVQWVHTSTPLIVPDPETETPTLLLQAHTNAPVDCVMALVPPQSSSSCELWGTSPAPLPMIGRRGGSIPPWVRMNEDTSSNATMMREWGLYFQKSLIKDGDGSMMDLRRAVEQEITNVELHIARNRPDLKLGADEFRFQEIASRNTQRFDLLVTKVEAVQSFVQSQVLQQGHVMAFLDQLLGTDWEFDVSIVYSKPGASFQGWHADGHHEDGAKDAGWDLNGWQHQLADPYAICLFLPLIDLNDDVGFTQFWPGSHRHRDLLGFGKLAEIMGSWDGKCCCGDGIWYDYRLFHRGMPNRSKLRPVVQILFRRSWYVERANYGTESIISRRRGE